MKINLYDILRYLYSQLSQQQRIETKYIIELYSIINRIIFSNHKYNKLNKKDQEEFKQEIVKNLFVNFNSATKDPNIFWAQDKIKNKTDQEISSYFYKIITTSYNNIVKDICSSEINLLYKVVNGICKNLLEKNLLNGLLEEVLYCRNIEINEQSANYDETEPIYFHFEIYNTKGTFDHKKIENLVLIIFNKYMENRYINLSNLVKLIANIAGIENMIIVDEPGGGEGEDVDDISVIKNLSTCENISEDLEINDILTRCWTDVEKEFKFNHELIKKAAAIFYYRYKKDITLNVLETMNDIVGDKKKSWIHKISVRFLNSVKLDKYFTKDSPELKKVNLLLYNLIKTKYNLEE